MGDFTRPKEGFRFRFGGMKLNVRPDAMPPGKYPLAINVREYEEGTIRSRPGVTDLFGGAQHTSFTDLRAYSAIQNNNFPRILARDTVDNIWLDNGTQVGTLLGTGASSGATFIPFRPSQSPNPYMYIANGSDYQKFSAPSPTNAVVQRKVGIAEPQVAPDAGISQQLLSVVSRPATTNNSYVNGGTAAATTTGARVTDQVVAVFPDPANTGMCSIEVGGGLMTAGSVSGIVLTNAGSGYGSAPSLNFSGGGGTGAQGYVTFTQQWDGHTFTFTLTGIVVTSGGSGYTSAPTVTLTGGGGTGATATAFIQSASQTIQGYQPFMDIIIGSVPPGNVFMVQDVFAPLANPLQIESIFYYSGASGLCVIVPSNIGTGPGIGNASNYDPLLFGALRRGALVQLNNAEVVLILNVTTGPDNTICFETTTVGTHVAGETITGIPTIYIQGVPTVGQAITSPTVSTSVTSGLGTVTQALAASPFVSGGSSFQPDDYVHISINIGTLGSITEIKLLFDVGDGSFTQNFYYYTLRPADLAAAIANTITQLAAAQEVSQRSAIDEEAAIAANNYGATFSGAQSASGAAQWTEILFPISQLTRVGNDNTRSLANVNSAQLLINANASSTIQFNSLHVLGGYQPDVGDVGAPYRYRVRPRSSVTGARGNPSPEMRYGVSPRRQSVLVMLPFAVYDAQIDTWDIFRYGGSVTEWRKIGQAPSSSGTFIDNYDDDAAGEGEALDFDNYEPWPSIDIPLNVTATGVFGTVALVTIPAPTNVLRYLPGNLVQIGGQNVYTLRKRPVLISGTTYRMEFEENAGGGGGAMALSIYEPALANQMLPYMWGPDVDGTVFAVGDPLRPGTLYFSKGNNPDSAPDSYNIEIVQPAEPLLGGEIVDGLGFVASTERWWALYPQPDNPLQRYNFVQTQDTRGLAAPFGHCNDGKSRYWWAKDGIYSSSQGSLTDADLYPLFPHEGVEGSDVIYNGIAIPAPNYALAAQFRLVYSLGFLYAFYPAVSTGLAGNVLVLNLKTGAWSLDNFADLNPLRTVFPVVLTGYHVEQQSESAGSLNPVLLFAGNITGIFLITTAQVFKQTDLSNDLGDPIQSTIAVAEFDAGDARAPKQWGDFFLDLQPSAAFGVVATPMSLGSPIAAPTTIPSGVNRTRLPVSVGGTLVSDFLGLLLQWTDDYTAQSAPTQLFMWQPSFDIQPARTIGWKTFGTSFGLQGFGHIQHIAIAWVSTTPITLTVTTFDGTSPQVITVPSSGGQYQKALFTLTFNKGQLFIFQATSTAPFQIFEDDIEIHVGAWSRQGPYQIFKSFGGAERAASPI
jgi:hypothetical protein